MNYRGTQRVREDMYFPGTIFTDDLAKLLRNMGAYKLAKIKFVQNDIEPVGVDKIILVERGFKIDNLFDRQYEAISGYADPGRTFLLSAHFTN